MNELKNQLINKDVEVVVDTNDLIGKKILGVFDDDAAFGYVGNTLTMIVTEDKYLYMNILEDDYDGIRRTHLTEDRLMGMVVNDYPDMDIINFLIKFGIVDEEKYNVYRKNRKLEIERKKNEADYEKYLRLKETFEER
ncbi:hypothetical protein [Mammaliicoccus lentus]|uniref:hypothetical protein n=1 Tax=Mammaliicoccus lentus TaxID=42858 RepID=UPI0010726812|nr:hypothetical protein [Mammaliicoccus lentus]MBF0793374.1 hypothetical protein [Mammaliicoccus lentus]TFV17875.1 hypothetical protein E4T78_01825 [Mammaliicoccus lentus]